MQIRTSRLAAPLAAAALLFGLQPAATGAAPEPAPDPRPVTVCMESPGDIDVINLARGKASRIFERVGVRILWPGRGCPDDAITIAYSIYTPAAELPGALAYALIPSRAIVVYYDRVQKAVASWHVQHLLA